MVKTGDVCETPREVNFEWRIKDFLLLDDQYVSSYESPEFYFSGASWEIHIYPNGETTHKSERWISLYVCRKSGNVPAAVDYSLGMKTVDGKTVLDRTFTRIFHDTYGHGLSEFIRRSELVERKPELLPSGVLTVICSLKKCGKNVDGNEDTQKIEKNACVESYTQTNDETGVWILQSYLRGILENGNISDVVLKVDDQEFKSHRCILARSPVFLAMMTHETKEKNSGVVDIPDVDPNVFSNFLNYLYTGRVENVTVQNVVKLYITADKYQVEELKKVGCDFMLKNLSVDNFCDFLSLSLQYVEKDLTDACSQFFIENALAIIVTSKWQVFVAQNPTASNELHIKHVTAIMSQLNK